MEGAIIIWKVSLIKQEVVREVQHTIERRPMEEELEEVRLPQQIPPLLAAVHQARLREIQETHPRERAADFLETRLSCSRM